MSNSNFDYEEYLKQNEIRMRIEIIKFNRDELRKIWQGKNSNLSFENWLAEMDRTLLGLKSLARSEVKE